MIIKALRCENVLPKNHLSSHPGKLAHRKYHGATIYRTFKKEWIISIWQVLLRSDLSNDGWQCLSDKLNRRADVTYFTALGLDSHRPISYSWGLSRMVVGDLRKTYGEAHRKKLTMQVFIMCITRLRSVYRSSANWQNKHILHLQEYGDHGRLMPNSKKFKTIKHSGYNIYSPKLHVN